MRNARVSMPAATVFAAVVLLLALAGPTSGTGLDTRVAPAAAQESATEQGMPFVSTQLYFGTGRHNGHPPITDEEFNTFVAEVVTPRFPSGLTIQEGRGQWRDKDGDINRERSFELTVLYPATEAHARNADIEYIRRLYCDMWELESVGRADARVLADF
ncbi:DUF3574 domain-containing protein [Streptomyces sp. NPDC003042]